MAEFVAVSALEKSVKSIFIIGLILLVRRILNVKSIKWANIILWTILFLYLIFPYSLLIQIEETSLYGLPWFILEPMILISRYTRIFARECGYLLSKANQVFVASLIFIYVVVQIAKRNKAMKNSILIEQDSRINKYISLFNLKRKVDVLINDKIQVPVTYGIVHPKIVLQSHILKDEELLKYVLIHEMIHIKKFDILFNHIKNLITCLYWYNIFILVASRYIEDDIEILCDKLVIQRVGDTVKNRKEYCLSMVKLIEQKEMMRKVVLKLHPAKERMVIMKKYKSSFLGVCALVIVVALSMPAFAEITITENNKVVSSEVPLQNRTNENDRVRIITDEEYSKLTLGDISLEKIRVANIDDIVTLSGLEHKSYKFNMESWTEPNHDGFTVNMSDMSCNGGLDYAIIIKENGNVIYKESFDKATTLTVKAYHNSRFEVIINNQSTKSLKYRVKINSYIR